MSPPPLVPGVRYYANPSTPQVRAEMTAGRLGCMTTPAQKNRVPEGAIYAADNGKFGKGWPGPDAWWSWLNETLEWYGRERCAFVTLPDVVCDAEATLEESLPWITRVGDLGVPVAFVAQDGCEVDRDLIPWGFFEVLFLGGSTAWKLSPAAAELTAHAKWRGLDVHMGRVNSRRRMRVAEAFGCDSADGTKLVFGPDVNLPGVLAWVRDSPSLFDRVSA